MIKVCPKCGSNKTKKNGKSKGVQVYLCNTCNKTFRNKRRKKKLMKELWFDYAFKKQTCRELSLEYSLDFRTIEKRLNQYTPPLKQHNPRPIHLIVDATYFGQRKEGSSWCVLVARDLKEKENITWLFAETETTLAYTTLREQVEDLGYTILSVTGDGFGGIKTAFFGISYQMCQVHMERLIIQRITRNPQTEAGQALLALTRTIYYTNSHLFNTRLKKYIERYRPFLNERSINEETGRKDWTHRELRRAVLSLNRLKLYLFTFEHNNQIPKMTNSLEGHFSHLKDVLKIHRGTSKDQAQKIIHSILLASTIAPDKKTKKKII